MRAADCKLGRGEPWIGLALAGLMTAALVLMLLVAPTERTMGDAQRIMYIHVAVAWFGLVGFVLLAVAGSMYLFRRNLGWDQWARAAGEVGWLCSTLTLATGSLWARAAWNTWWTWDPRLTASLMLWILYAGYFVLRASSEDAHRQARSSAVLGIVGVLDVPLIVMATRWFRGMHPVRPQIEPMMRIVLLTSLVALTSLFVVLVVRRRGQLILASQLESLERNRA